MKPEKLIISGWGPYKDLVKIDFNKFGGQGLFLITGATGAGKTTIFDAITYALYGSLSGEIRDKERNSVRSDFADGDTPTYVEFQMSHGGNRYYIKRNPEYLRPKKRSVGETAFTKEKENATLRVEKNLHKEGNSADDIIIEGVKEVNAYLKEVMVLDYVQFKQLSMIAQGEFARLLTAPPKDKTRIFREIFGTGVYERFTFQLGQKAKVKYQSIMEHKYKLEEAVRLLEDTIRESGLPEEEKGQFEALISAKNWNYDGLENYLEDQTKAVKKFWKDGEKRLAKLEGMLTEQKEQLTRGEEENKRIQEYLKAEESRKRLDMLSEDMNQKERLGKQAVNAGWVEPGEMNLMNAQKQLQMFLKEEETLTADIRSKEMQLKELLPFWKKRSALESFIQDMQIFETQSKLLTEVQQALKEKKLAENRQKEVFLKAEKRSILLKQEYEEAIRVQRRAAIGIAAKLLREGEPCPVCGALEHPNPARIQESILTEEELDGLKETLDLAEQEMNECYKEVVVLQTLLKELQDKQEMAQDAVNQVQNRLNMILESASDDIFVRFYRQESSLAAKKLQDIMENFANLQVILQEREERGNQLADIINRQKIDVKNATIRFQELLEQYGFASREAYEQAHLPRGEREKLIKETEDYHRRVSANRELLFHLEQSITARELLELQPLREAAEKLQADRDKALTEVKRWERMLHELEKVCKEFDRKRQQLEKLNGEYGCIKELENIASGNNPKKLVFEQYVLAGYFEEILIAANIRFRKMTSGRYEMHRAQEVGDGRTKDNLEIQVMDYYTGKLRSVRTLSGGESFKASLSLALGLSDVIQSMNGGIRIEALFIDEGFGALDSESLDQACETLLSLVESDRIIGIISHVPELRERISKQIVIDKMGSGSTLKIVV